MLSRQTLKSALFHSLRFAFRMVPMTEGRRDALRASFLGKFSSMRPSAVHGKPPSAKRSHRARATSGARAIGFMPHQTEALPSPLGTTLVAFYLPQFHAIPENDAWWGKGFTEWHNVGRALPQFEGHAQPRLPGSLGYYDLTQPGTMRAQAALAQEYGIGAFCFYFYWFGGKTLLEKPLQQWLLDRSITLPFCLCWANENWSRRWDGRADDILIAQQHGDDDDLAFIAHVAVYLRDSRYLRIDGKPILLVYRPNLLPDAKATAARWRQWCRDNEIGEIFIAYMQSFERPDPRDLGFDAAVEFPPNLASPADITGAQYLLNEDYSGQALDWRELAADYQSRLTPGYKLFPGVNCGWDNEPRRPGKGRTYLHASPRRYRDWLQYTIASRLPAAPASERLVFINAWNEWAEGAVLEPDSRLGHAWLHATRSALKSATVPTSAPAPKRLCVVVHAWYPEAFVQILSTLQTYGLPLRVIVTTTPEKAPQIQALLDAQGIRAELEVRENRGRDILPFLHVADRLLNEGEELVLKLHTKHSPHRTDGARWRTELLERLASPHRAGRIFQSFLEDPALGLVAPEGHLQPLSYYWGANQENVNYLTARLGIDPVRMQKDDFVSGSMFWVRLAALRPLLDAHLDDWEFETEAAQLDGTFAHAIERIFTLCARAEGLRVEDAATVCREPSDSTSGTYRYADRG